jgi:hypothetical protein
MGIGYAFPRPRESCTRMDVISTGRKVFLGSSEEIANAPGMSVVPFVSRHSVYFANVPNAVLPPL